MRQLTAILLITLGLVAVACLQQRKGRTHQFMVVKSDDEWKKQLTAQQYPILREKAFTGEYYDYHDQGIYQCAGCGQPLFSSEAKFESGTGWPSFYQPTSDTASFIVTNIGYSVIRDEVAC